MQNYYLILPAPTSFSKSFPLPFPKPILYMQRSAHLSRVSRCLWETVVFNQVVSVLLFYQCYLPFLPKVQYPYRQIEPRSEWWTSDILVNLWNTITITIHIFQERMCNKYTIVGGGHRKQRISLDCENVLLLITVSNISTKSTQVYHRQHK